MSRKTLLVEMCNMIEKMSERQRIARVRKLALNSVEDAKFIRQYFPKLFVEAFPTPFTSVSSEETSSAL
ncbi:MAG TPA: hypothetical protein VG028_15440 [Terriglobia bacterium]|nr:hypothetical protein [Terriglobia bacterium]